MPIYTWLSVHIRHFYHSMLAHRIHLHGDDIDFLYIKSESIKIKTDELLYILPDLFDTIRQ